MTLPQAARKLEKYIITLPSAKQFNMLSREPRKAMMTLQDSAYNARISIERYFNSDDSIEQAQYLGSSLENIKVVSENILAAGQHDLLGPVDVAHLSALAEHIKERLQ